MWSGHKLKRHPKVALGFAGWELFSNFYPANILVSLEACVMNVDNFVALTHTDKSLFWNIRQLPSS